MPQVSSQGHDTVLLVGLIRQEISGSSVGLVSQQRGGQDGSTTCGCTVRPRANGRGWVGPMRSVNRGRTGLWALRRLAMFLGRDLTPQVGPIRQEISGSSEERLQRIRSFMVSMTSGHTARANGRGWAGRTLPTNKGCT